MFGGASQFSFVDLKQKFVYLVVVESDLSGHNWNKLHALGYLNWLLKKIIFRNIRNSFRMTRFHERVRPSDAKSTAKKVKGILA